MKKFALICLLIPAVASAQFRVTDEKGKYLLFMDSTGKVAVIDTMRSIQLLIAQVMQYEQTERARNQLLVMLNGIVPYIDSTGRVTNREQVAAILSRYRQLIKHPKP